MKNKASFLLRNRVRRSFSHNSITLPCLENTRIAFISTFVPRKCGIASYTKSLSDAINLLNPERLIEVIALDHPTSENLKYPWEATRRIRQHVWEDYEQALLYLNNSIIDIVGIQHEFGIFGGTDGDYIVKFAQQLKKPFIVTFHTLLQSPTAHQKTVVRSLCQKAAAVVVMLPVAQDILKNVYGIDGQKISTIPIGSPDFPFTDDSNQAKKLLGLEDRILMSSINLLGPGRGFEHAIKAVSKIVKDYPNFLYLVVGQTHPVILSAQGESYRRKLQKLVSRLKLKKNVRFVNRFVSYKRLMEYIKASDFYITPYENLEQISSQALPYAIAAGKLCISTPYRYAQEILSGGRGYLVEAGSPDDIAQAILHGLGYPDRALEIRKKCYLHGREIVWPRVGYLYLKLAKDIIGQSAKTTVFPKPRLDYILKMTDQLGMWEHSSGEEVNCQEGYAVDDNARALIVALLHKNNRLAKKYLDFLLNAESEGLMYCDLCSQKERVGQPGAGDWFGRSFWAVCFALAHGSRDVKPTAKKLFIKLFPTLRKLTFLRPKAFCLLGLCLLGKNPGFRGQGIASARDQLASELLTAYRTNSNEQWRWFETILTYDNSRLPQALLAYSRLTGNKEAEDIGLASINFLIDSTYDMLDGCFKFVGTKGWYPQGGRKTTEDEQPIDAGSTAESLIEAYLVTKKQYYLDLAQKALAWYHGDNALRQPLYNYKNHSVHDGLGRGLGENGVSLNQGAESVLSYHLGYFALLAAATAKSQDQTAGKSFYAPQKSIFYSPASSNFLWLPLQLLHQVYQETIHQATTVLDDLYSLFLQGNHGLFLG